MKRVVRKVFTTTQVARICRVAPRTVHKWFDCGRLKGYLIPGTLDRRIPRDQLVKFLEEQCFCEPLEAVSIFDGPENPA